LEVVVEEKEENLIEEGEKEKLNETYLDQNPLEKHLIENGDGSENGRNLTFEVFEATKLYYERPCVTCLLPRRPKVSHCKVCNNCIRGFDHHCTLLNNCIGKNNVKPFTWLLVFEWLYAVGMTAIGVIFLLYEPYKTRVQTQELLNRPFTMTYELYLNASVFVICSIKFVFFLCCRAHIHFGIQLIWMMAELIIVQIIELICLSGTSTVASLFTSCGSSIVMLVSPLLVKHLRLAAYRMSEKEFVARQETCNEMGLFFEGEKGDPLLARMGCCAKTGNLCKFLFTF